MAQRAQVPVAYGHSHQLKFSSDLGPHSLYSLHKSVFGSEVQRGDNSRDPFPAGLVRYEGDGGKQKNGVYNLNPQVQAREMWSP